VEAGGAGYALHAQVEPAVAAGDEDVVAVARHAADDADDLLGALAGCEDDFGVTLAQGAVVVNLGEAQVLER